jgi:hypothetical protein
MHASDRNKRVARTAFAGLVAALCLLSSATARELKSHVTDLEQIPRVHPEYPVPNEPNQLFYVERSSNSNTVIYTANLDAKGHLNPDKPVIAYWRWFNRGGYIKQLNFAERMMAYGINSVKHDGPNGAYSFKIAALPERTLYVGLDGKGHPEVFGKSGDRWARLAYIYLEVDDSGMLPDVPAMDFFGYDRTTGKPLREHVTRH